MLASRSVLGREDRIIPATLLAAGLHLLVIFGVGFGFDLPSSRSQATAVTFTLTPTSEAPDEARLTAADNQQGALETQGEQPQRYSEPTVSIAPQVAANATSGQTLQAQDIAERIEALQREVKALSGSQSQTNPRAGSVATRRALDADYLLRWRQRVEQVGNVLYRRVTARYGSGDVRLLVVVTADGTLEQVRVIGSSGTPELDDAAVATVRQAAPFPAFSAALRAETERLEIVRTWQFRSQGETGSN